MLTEVKSWTEKKTLIVGFVVFSVESKREPVYGLFSPDGGCQHQIGQIHLDPLLTIFSRMTMMLLGKWIIACGSQFSSQCYSYHIESDIWTVYSGSSVVHPTHGVVHQGRIYLPDILTPEVFNPFTKNWSYWPTEPSVSQSSCFVSWKDSIFKFGGISFEKYVSRYDPVANLWLLESTSAPFELSNSGCVALPNDNILIVGSDYSSQYFKAYIEYNVSSKSWSGMMYGNVNHYAPVPILLGSRVFVITTSDSVIVEEYHYSNQTITTSVQNFSMKIDGYSSSIAVPAKWFSLLPGGCFGVF